jgi:hypothetical protein
MGVTFGVCWLLRPLFQSMAELMNTFVVNKKFLHDAPKLPAMPGIERALCTMPALHSRSAHYSKITHFCDKMKGAATQPPCTIAGEGSARNATVYCSHRHWTAERQKAADKAY